MTDVLTSSDIEAYRATHTDHEAKFAAFLDFAGRGHLAGTTARDNSAYAIQVVTQQNFGPIKSRRYFASTRLTGAGDGSTFSEIQEGDVRSLGLAKANTYKNFKSRALNEFYELNLYKLNPSARRPLVSNAARPAAEIDL